MRSDINIVYWKNKEGVYLHYYDFNASQQNSALTAHSFVGKTDYDLYPATLAEIYRQQDLAVIASGQMKNCEIRLPHDSNLLPAIKQPLRDAENNIIGVITNINTTTLPRAEKAAIKKLVQETVGTDMPGNFSTTESVRYLRDYLENIIALTPGHVFWHDRNNVFLGCNDLHAKLAGLKSRKEIVGKTNYDLPWREQAKELNATNTKIMESGIAQELEEYGDSINGLGFYLSHKAPLRDPFDNNKVIGLVGVSFDITDRKKAEEERLNVILKAANMGWWTWDFADDVFVHEYIHHEEPYYFKGSSAEAITYAHLADQAQLRAAMLQAYEKQIPLDIEYRLIWPSGNMRHIAMRGKIVENRRGEALRMVGVCWDITHRKALENALHQQQLDLAQISRLNAMGELASTLAHELNQPLATINNYLQGCMIRLKSGNFQPDDLLNALQKASTQSSRAGEIIHRMKNFIRKGKLYYEATDLNKIIKEVITIIQYEPAAQIINIHTDLADNLPVLELDKIQIGQVILNLLRNAIEALQQAPSISRPEIWVKSSWQSQEVCVDIIDNGPGFSSELATQLFTPYFTTKKNGTGIGLAICRTIIEAHNGSLTILPHNQQGAWFRFKLPLATQVTNTAKTMLA